MSRSKWRSEGDIDATLPRCGRHQQPAASMVDVIPVETQRRKRGLMLEVWDGNWVAAEAMEVVAQATEGSGGDEILLPLFPLTSLSFQ
jgi:hypothetical protein